MPPVPKRKLSYGRKRRKYHNKHLKAPSTVPCSHCGAAKQSHRACSECGEK